MRTGNAALKKFCVWARNRSPTSEQYMYWLIHEFNWRWNAKTRVYEEDSYEVYAKYIKAHNKAV